MFFITSLPVSIGLYFNTKYHDAADRFRPIANKVSTLLFIIIVTAALASEWDTFTRNLYILGPAIIVLMLVMLFISYNCTKWFGMNKKKTITIAIESSIQNATVGITIGNLILKQDTGLSILSKDKQSELKDLVENSYIQTVIKFEDGVGVLEMNNFLSQELGDRMFFKSDNKAPVVAKLGKGRPLFGLSMNLDLKKVQGLVNEFSPDAMIELGRAMGGPAQFALMAAGDEGIVGLFNGQFGIVTVGEQKMMGGVIPDFNLFIGLEKKGKYIGNLAKDFMSYGSTEITLNDDGLSASTNPIYASSASVSLKLPKGCEGFGKSGVSAFLNLEGLEGISKILNAVKYITFEYNENGGVLYIKAKKAQENILKQTAQGLIEEFSSEINRISL